MRKIFALFVLAAALVSGCVLFPAVEGSGFLTDTEYAFTGFTSVSIEQTCKLVIVPDSVYSVSVTCDDNIVSYLDVTLTGGEVEIGLKDWTNYRNVTFNAEVHMPALDGLALSGASEARVQSGFASGAGLGVTISGDSSVEMDALSCGGFTADISGASSLAATALSASSLDVVLSGMSDITASGTAPSMSINASGMSTAHLLNVASSSADVVLSGMSEAWLNVPGTIRLEASGDSTLYFQGSPSFVILELSGGSSISKL